MTCGPRKLRSECGRGRRESATASATVNSGVVPGNQPASGVGLRRVRRCRRRPGSSQDHHLQVLSLIVTAEVKVGSGLAGSWRQTLRAGSRIAPSLAARPDLRSTTSRSHATSDQHARRSTRLRGGAGESVERRAGPSSGRSRGRTHLRRTAPRPRQSIPRPPAVVAPSTRDRTLSVSERVSCSRPPTHLS